MRNMFPILFHYGEFVIPTFFTLVMIGALVASFYMYFFAAKHGYSQVVALDIGIVGAIAGILGGRLFHIFFEELEFYIEDWTHAFEFWRGGFVSYGAFIGGTLAVIVYLKLRKLSVAKYADLVGVALPLVVFFVRIGCLGAGCCYGKPTDFFLHLTFHNPTVPAGEHYLGLPLHPTQIYSIAYSIFLFWFLNWRYPRRRFNGEIALLFFMIYPLLRFLNEFLRGDADRGVYFGGWLSTAQITGFFVFAVSLILYIRSYRRSKN